MLRDYSEFLNPRCCRSDFVAGGLRVSFGVSVTISDTLWAYSVRGSRLPCVCTNNSCHNRYCKSFACDRCRRKWDHHDADYDVSRGIEADRCHGHHDTGGRPTRGGCAGTKRHSDDAWRPSSATSQRAADVDESSCGGWRQRSDGRIPGDVQVGWNVRCHKDETLLNVHY